MDGPYLAPTIYEVDKTDAKAREEIFGPILSVIEVASEEEAIELANDTEYGLAALSLAQISENPSVRPAPSVLGPSP